MTVPGPVRIGLRAPRTLFRVAAGPRIGFGHLVRVRSLARALGVRPVVALRGGPVAVTAARHLGCRLMSGAPGRVLSEHPAEVLVIDDPRPAAGAPWVAAARARGIPVVALVDRGVGAWDADLGIDGGLGAPLMRNVARRWLRGPRYMVLDPAFSAARRQGRASGRRSVVIALGGGVHASYGHRLAERLTRQLRCPTIHVAPGFTATDSRRGSVGDAALSRPGRVHATRLAAAEVAIVAGGVSLYEACCLGVPTIAVSVVPAQRGTVRAFARAGAVVDAGAVRAIARRDFEHLARRVHQLLADPGRCERLTERAAHVVDGKGGERVSRAVCRLAAAA